MDYTNTLHETLKAVQGDARIVFYTGWNLITLNKRQSIALIRELIKLDYGESRAIEDRPEIRRLSTTIIEIRRP